MSLCQSLVRSSNNVVVALKLVSLHQQGVIKILVLKKGMADARNEIMQHCIEVTILSAGT